MTKQKVSDLPKEEQEKIIAQMKELKIRGVYTTFTVEKAQELIKKAQENAENIDGETTPDDTVQNDEQGGENEPEEQQDEQGEENAENDKTDAGENPGKEENKEPQKEVKAAKEKPAKNLKCHICLSKVIDGKCTGCGFELKL